MSYPSPTACAHVWLRGIADGEHGGDAPALDDPELCRIYVDARGIGTKRSGRDTMNPARAPLFASDFCRSVLEATP